VVYLFVECVRAYNECGVQNFELGLIGGHSLHPNEQPGGHSYYYRDAPGMSSRASLATRDLSQQRYRFLPRAK